MLTIGEILDGKYRVEALIGSGGMGSVYRAHHISLDSARAIKLMRPELARDDSFVHRFENEAHLAEGVRHPNVVALYDFATLPNGTKYIVWELVEGETLRDFLERGDIFTDADAIRLVAEIGGGLTAAHEQGILHRDVSPDNIMLCDRGSGLGQTTKLLDFGVAKAAGTPQSLATTTGMVFGKIGYASPEQMGLLKGEDSLDARTDVFSLAAVTYAMLTGEPPFVTSSMRSFLHDLMIAPESELRARFAATLDERWREPLTRALARNRDERPPTMEAFVDEIQGLSTPSRPRGDAPDVPGRRQRTLRLAAIPIVGGALVVAYALRLDFSSAPTQRPVELEVPALDFTADVDNPFTVPDEEIRDDNPAVSSDGVPEDVDETQRAGPNEHLDTQTGDDLGNAVSSPTETANEPASQPGNNRNNGTEVTNLGDISFEDELTAERPQEAVAETEAANESASQPDNNRNNGTEVKDLGDGGFEDERPAERPQEIIVEDEGEPETSTLHQVVPKPPQLLKEVAPRHPARALKMGIEGTVILRIEIAPNGDVVDAVLVEGVDEELIRAAEEAVFQWKYEPRSESVQIDVSIEFDPSS